MTLTLTPAPRRGSTMTTAATPLPSVSIIIPAHNEELTIGRCLRAAVNQSVPAAEIIVVDNRSTDATSQVAHRIAHENPAARLRIVSQFDALGVVPTRNLGFAEATGDVLGRIDADSVVASDWVARVASAMADPTVAAVTGPVTYYDLPFRGPSRTSDDVVRRTLRRLGTKYPFLYGSNMAIRATAWDAIANDACEDRDDLLHEDIDLSVHLHDAGMRVAYVPPMRAHVSARRLRTSPGSFRAYTRRFERTYASHGIRHWYLKAPQALLQGIYWSSRVAHSISPAPRSVPV